MLSHKQNFRFLSKGVFINITLFILLACYYLYYFNKGIVLGDEGYSMHIAERILQGQIPYKDFFLQYPPGYFYILAGLYKIFGVSVIVGRFLSLTFCLEIFIVALLLLKNFGIISNKSKILTLLALASFGYPLINIPVVVWPTVVITGIIMLIILKLFTNYNKNFLVIISVFLSILFFIKQNIAIVEIITINIIIIFDVLKRKKSFLLLLTALCLLNSIWLIITFFWIYIFFLRNNLSILLEFISFNQRYLNIYPFTYPPLSFLLQPLGILKLLPYYFPIAFLIILLIRLSLKNKDTKIAIFFLPLVGFFTTIYPTSDLLHVYPYYGLLLVSLIIFTTRLTKYRIVFYTAILLSIISGFYLTIYREYYRYQPSYKFQNTFLNIPRAKGIFVDKSSSDSISYLYHFINTYTKKNDYIFVYSFSPMLYSLLERKNPSPYSIYYPGYLTTKEEKTTIDDIQVKKVVYIISDGFDKIPTPLSKWILKKKKIKQINQFTIYTTKN